ncbi:MAG: LysM peptidoglycan-binding domain-containing protein [Armatimonadetes bacterium]|nr:LysM peptidoglycan-binding domain-containing protein [Armatimonadota bacterium]HPO72934.1 LysM peptidoglycan-binding domain-containing protein [Armatimonadota bacterium]
MNKRDGVIPNTQTMRAVALRAGTRTAGCTLWAVIACAWLAPPGAASPDARASAPLRTHVVRAGEHLSKIAKEYGVPVKALAEANGIAHPDRVPPGKKLVIPGAASAEVATPAAKPAKRIEVADVDPDYRPPTRSSKPKARAPGKNASKQTKPQVPITSRGGSNNNPARGTAAGAVPQSGAGTATEAPHTRQLEPPLAQRRAPDPNARISLNFADVPARDALAAISAHTGVDTLITPGTTGNVSINLRDRTADEAIRQVAAVAGLSVAQIGGTYVVGPAAEVQKAVAELGKTEVVTLRHITPDQAKEVLARAVPRLNVETAGKALILSGLPEDLEAARTALEGIDAAAPAAPSSKTEFALLRHADPEMVERMVCEAFPNLKVTRQDRLFTMTGSPADLASASQAIKMLDAPPPAAQVAATPTPQRETFIYELRYTNPQRAEEALKKLLPDLVVASAPEATAPPAATFQPLSLGMMGGTNGSGFTFSSTGVGTGSGTSGPYAQPLARSTRLVLMGTPADIATARQILEETDVAPPMVRIEAAIVEVNKADVRELGIDWNLTNFGTTVTVPGGSGLNFGNLQYSSPSFRATLQALITESRARLIANPSISVVNNEDANIFIGDLRRFRGINVVSPDVGTVVGTETIPVGVALLIRPRIHPDQSVTLKVHPVVSTVSEIIDGLPQTASREADTTVRLARGEQLVIGGLDRDEIVRTVRRLPILSDIPLVGELFKTRSTRTATTELLIFVAAYPVEPEAAPPVSEFPRPILELEP